MHKKVLVFSIALEGFEQTFADCIKTQVDYCNRFQYEYLLVNQTPFHLTRDEAAWLKVPLIRAALAANYEWVAFLDADCEIRSHTPDFPEYLSAISTNRTIFLAPGFSGRINSGVILVRNSPESLKFFDTILANADIEITSPEDSVGWGENGHFIHYGKNHPTVYLLEHRLWNNNSKLDKASFIQHYVTGPMREWYISNRVVQKKNRTSNNSFIGKGINKIFKILGKQFPKSEPPRMVSESINKLMPYYLKKYSAFRNK